MRKKMLAGNWKMNKTPDETLAYFRDFLPLVAGHDRDEIVVCPPYTDVQAAIEVARGSNVAIGAQNVHWKAEGAYTGEISAPMLVSLGVAMVPVGAGLFLISLDRPGAEPLMTASSLIGIGVAAGGK